MLNQRLKKQITEAGYQNTNRSNKPAVKPLSKTKKPSVNAVSKSNKTVNTKSKKSTNDVLKIIPIGGLNEIGKNMTVLEYRDQILIIDCGMSFPEDDMYGIDVVIPDFSYLEKMQRRSSVL